MVREACITSSLRHPCVLTFFGVLEGDFPMTVLEYMNTGSLRSGLRALAQSGCQVSPRTPKVGTSDAARPPMQTDFKEFLLAADSAIHQAARQ